MFVVIIQIYVCPLLKTTLSWLILYFYSSSLNLGCVGGESIRNGKRNHWNVIIDFLNNIWSSLS